MPSTHIDLCLTVPVVSEVAYTASMAGQNGAGAAAAAAAAAVGNTFSAETFFATQEPPPRLPQLLEGVAEFVAHHAREKRRVVLVTVSVSLF